MNRKRIALLLIAVLLLSMAAACGRRNDAAQENQTNNNMNNGTNNGTPQNDTPGNDMTSNDMTGNDLSNNNMNNSGMNGSTADDRGEYPTFPNNLATGAEVALDDLIATLGLTATDLETAMRDVATVGDNVDGARTYRHKLLGHEADVSYGFDDQDMIDRVTVKTQKNRMDAWRTELNDTLGATGVEGQTDTWDYSDSRVKITEEGDHLLITIEKPKG